LLSNKGFYCSCGRLHKADVKEVAIGQGVLKNTVEIMERHGGTRPFIIADKNTYQAAGRALCELFESKGITYTCFIFPQERIIPDEFSTGQVVMALDSKCDFIIGVGSGTINDIGKLVAKTARLNYAIVCTAPSMDGFSSLNSSMIVNRLKGTMDTVCPVAIIADTDILCQAPLKLLQAGLGDILAKYISICEWRISHLITKEYYCEKVAELVRRSVKKCVSLAEGLPARDPETISGIIEGLILSGITMNFAGYSRPASGIEHFFSHIWDMRALELERESELHGIQVGIGTLLSLRIFDFIRQVVPDRKKALESVDKFNLRKWHAFLRDFLGKSGEALIELEEKEGKYDKLKHSVRLEIIIDNWQSIQDIISEELPDYDTVAELLRSTHAPVLPKDINISHEEVRHTFAATKDVRDKYVASRLLWDLGLLEEAAEQL
jgi:glycerol-1-phosphate dehydrogenase [NAD(P)+]